MPGKQYRIAEGRFAYIRWRISWLDFDIIYFSATRLVTPSENAAIDLYWLPLGLVRTRFA